ncbi:complement C1q-like protein 2 [Colossoma macropomum]|uniref:complement C1q-like protein 2 n=1 Tax=Colossoma macropomum TaxID=42526 RepID=UPI0018646416|nr:complement C1q-like protein 2 [Colossoma macropomum]
MRVSVVLLWLFLSCVQLQRADDQLTVRDVQLLNKGNMERSALEKTHHYDDEFTELRELKDMVTQLREQLQSSQSQIEELRKQNAAINNRLVEVSQVNSALKWSLEALREGNAKVRKVAFLFGSGLNGYLGPLGVDTILVFRKEITNIGNAYSPITGVFTAPLRGVYYFRFNVLGSNSYWMTIDLYKNQERIITAAEYPGGQHEYSVGGATLLLQKGDLVYLKLRATCQIYDSADNLTTFTGFLLFPM